MRSHYAIRLSFGVRVRCHQGKLVLVAFAEVMGFFDVEHCSIWQIAVGSVAHQQLYRILEIQTR